MIKLTKLNGQTFYLDSEKIEAIESTPDTVITLINGKTYMVKENLRVVLRRIYKYRRRIYSKICDNIKNNKKGLDCL